MGCQPSNTIGRFAGVPCAADPTGHTTITVHGNVTATDANTVLLRELTVGGNVTLTGGGGEIPWSIKGNTIGRNLTISDVTADWLGVQFNWIGGNATLTNITALDPGDPGRTVAVVENTVGRNLICTGLAPACREVSSPARSTTSVTRRSVSAQPWSDPRFARGVRPPPSGSYGWRTGAARSAG